MKKVLVFVYAFIIFMIVDIGVIVYLLTKPECERDPTEYQLVIEDDYIIISYYSRKVTQLPLDSTCNLGDILIKDNE